MYVEQQYIRHRVASHAQGRFHRIECADASVTRRAVDDQPQAFTRGAVVFDNCNPNVFAHRSENCYAGILERVKRGELNAPNQTNARAGLSALTSVAAAGLTG